MLSQLYIKNVAVIKEASIDFAPGLNIFTGETGAGKTILINAINAVLGERTSRDIIRTGEDSAVITAVFDELPQQVHLRLCDLGYDLDPEDSLLVSRTLHSDGKTQCKLNGQPATVSMLKSIASMLINIHGQHDSQQLLAAEKHLGYIDAYGGLGEELAAYRVEFEALKAIYERINELSTDEAEKAHKTDLLTYQIGEISAAELTPGEEEELMAQRTVARNSERITQSLAAALTLIQGDESGEIPGAAELLEQIAEQLSDVGRYLPDYESLATTIRSHQYDLEESASSIQDSLEEMEYDPARLESIEERLSVIQQLKRKYGSDIPAILEFLERAKQELDDITFSEEKLTALEQQRSEQFSRCHALAQELSRKRHSAAEAFIKKIEEELRFLDMASVRFMPRFREKALSSTGMDEFELMVSTNVGEEPKPLAKIASGGELSRIMLAMKNVLADKDQVGTMIFDEIDTGVSGRAAQKIGRKLHEVSRGRQVICVTHLAQVAAFADHHLLISKNVLEGKTYTTVKPLTASDRVKELARIMGGDVVTSATLNAAEELLEKSK